MRRQKLSKLMKEMAQRVLKDPSAIPSSEAVHASLLLSHVAWNRALGYPASLADYTGLPGEFEASNPDDSRKTLVCGMREGNIHVEWTEAPEG